MAPALAASTAASAICLGVIGTRWLRALVSPPEIVARLSEELRKILAQPDVQQKIAEQGGEVHSGKAEDLKAWLTENTKAYAEIIKAAGVKIE